MRRDNTCGFCASPARLVAALAMLPAALFALAARAELVGAMPGALSVDGGNAAYIVPIDLPPGAGGMTPELSLRVGPSSVAELRGLSTIHRCIGSQERDGRDRDILFNDGDHYCVDGQRLLEIGENTGAFRLEVDSLTHFKRIGQGRPQRFESLTKAGQRLVYGATANSTAPYSGTSGMAWYVDRIEDAAGNAITVQYINATMLNQRRLVRDPSVIEYGGYRVSFHYALRMDGPHRPYILGARLQEPRRLERIDISELGQARPFRSYLMTYRVAHGMPDRLASVQMCGGAVAVQSCLRKTRFSWRLADAYGTELSEAEFNYFRRTAPFSAPVKLAAVGASFATDADGNRHAWPGGGPRLLADIDGDGAPEIIGFGRTMRVSRNAGDGSFLAAVNAGMLQSTTAAPIDALNGWNNSVGGYRFVRDVNGDGRADAVGLVIQPETVYDIYIAWGTENNQFGPVQKVTSAAGPVVPLPGPNAHVPCAQRPNYYDRVTCEVSDTSRSLRVRDEVTMSDIDGDGREDLVLFLRTGVYVAHANGSGFAPFVVVNSFIRSGWRGSLASGYDARFYSRRAVDLNRDGRADFVAFGSGDVQGSISTRGGTGYAPPNRVSLYMGAYHPHQRLRPGRYFADVNGDGNLDLVAFNGFSGNHDEVIVDLAAGRDHISRRGESFAGTHDFGSEIDRARGAMLGDVNGDGRADILLMTRDGISIALASRSTLRTGKVKFLSPTLWPYLGTAKGWAVRHATVLGDVDRNGSLDLVAFGPHAVYVAKNRFNADPPLLSKVVDGLGSETRIAYGSARDGAPLYQPSTASVWPLRDVPAAHILLVSEVQRDDGMGGFNTARYRYGGLKVRLGSDSRPGFAWTEVEDVNTNTVTRVDLHQHFPYIGLPHTVQVSVDGELISKAEHTYAKRDAHAGPPPAAGAAQSSGASSDLERRLLVYRSASVERFWELGATAPYRRMHTANSQVDSFGNVGHVSTSVDAGAGSAAFSTAATYRYNNDAATWRLGRLASASVRHGAAGASQLREADYLYHSNGLLASATLRAAGTEKALTTEYGYDSFGNLTRVSLRPAGALASSARVSTTQYDAAGRSPIGSTNALGHAERFVYGRSSGEIASQTGPNGRTTTWQRDVFGRLLATRHPDGVSDRVARHGLPDSACPNAVPHAVWCVRRWSEAAGDVSHGHETRYYDSLSRVLQVAEVGFDGRAALVDTRYDAAGRVAWVTRPYFAGERTYRSERQYDALGRETTRRSQRAFSGWRETKTAYDGLALTLTQPNGRRRLLRSDPAGRPVEVIDDLDGFRVVTSLSRDVQRHLVGGNVAGRRLTRAQYGRLGNLLSTHDDDLGRWSYVHNAFGELVSHVDAKGVRTRYAYDALGRLLSREAPEGASRWEWDSAANGIGQLAAAAGPDGFRETYRYDALGRLAKTERATVPTPGVAATTMTMTASYDALGRLARSTWPGGFELQRNYNRHGWLEALRSPRRWVPDYAHSTFASQSLQLTGRAYLDVSSARGHLQQAMYYRDLGDALLRLLDEIESSGLMLHHAQTHEHLARMLRWGVNSFLETGQRHLAMAAERGLLGHNFQVFLEALKVHNSLPGQVNVTNPAPVIPVLPPRCDPEALSRGDADACRYDAETSMALHFEQAALHLALAKLWRSRSAMADEMRSDNAPTAAPAALRSHASEARELAESSDGEIREAHQLLARSLELRAFIVEDRQRGRSFKLLDRDFAADAADATELAMFLHQLGAQGLVQARYVAAALTANAQDADHVYWWRAAQRDAAGEVTRSVAGNGLETSRLHDPSTGDLIYSALSLSPRKRQHTRSYRYDDLGNVVYRRWHEAQGQEEFFYDGLGRLSRAKGYLTILASGARRSIARILPNYEHSYDTFGNIAWKENVHYIYEPVQAKPDRLLRTVKWEKTDNFAYDGNGNVLSASGRHIAWSSDNRPVMIRAGSSTLRFAYAPSSDRHRQQGMGSSGTSVAHYMGAGYQRIEQDGVASHRYHVFVDGALVAVQSRLDSPTATAVQTRYLHHDALGGVDAVTDYRGEILARQGFGVYGATRAPPPKFTYPRSVGLADDIEAALVSSTTPRGFAGHESLGSVGLVHMNGRAYDPRLGRFLSPDPWVQSPLDGQSHNRYAYARNNPLKYIDPDGHRITIRGISKKFRDALGHLEAGLRELVRLTAIAFVLVWVTPSPTVHDWLHGYFLYYARHRFNNLTPTDTFGRGEGRVDPVDPNAGYDVRGWVDSFDPWWGPWSPLTGTPQNGNVSRGMGADKFDNGARSAAFAHALGSRWARTHAPPAAGAESALGRVLCRFGDRRRRCWTYIPPNALGPNDAMRIGGPLPPLADRIGSVHHRDRYATTENGADGIVVAPRADAPRADSAAF